MKRVCYVNINTNLVENVGVFDETAPDSVQPKTPRPGFLWIFDEAAGKGWTNQGGQLIAPPSEPVEPPVKTISLEDVIAVLRASDPKLAEDLDQKLIEKG